MVRMLGRDIAWLAAVGFPRYTSAPGPADGGYA